MRLTFLRRYRWRVVGMGMFLLPVLASACAGVPITTTDTSTVSSVRGGTVIISTPTPTTAIPGSLQLTGQVKSVNASTIIVQMPDGPLTMSITSRTDLSHDNNGLPAVGQPVKVDSSFINGAFVATKLESTDAKDAQDQNIVQYQGQALSPVGADNILHFGVGNKTWNFQITSSTILSKQLNNTNAIQAQQPLKIKVQFSGSQGAALKIDTDS